MVGERAVAAAIVVVAIGAAVAIALSLRDREPGARCGPGFVATGARCVPPDPAHCPSPLVSAAAGCDAPAITVLLPASALAVGPSDWEAEGRVLPRSVHVQAFRIDAFEVTRGRLGLPGDAARAAAGVTRERAAAFCASAGGRLPTEDEWIVAAASATNPPRRYPWGDTGAVCRRAAWGLEGLCTHGADGPDTVGAHPAGDSPLGLHDLAGNVAEWVSDDAPAGDPPGAARAGLVKGGSWRDALASELRIWAGRQVAVDAEDPAVGFRCVYAP
jgi:formylglycine-generating enzyme required for sulfatase activity